MCYTTLSHILCFSKYITHKFLIKWQGVFAHPLLSNLFDKLMRRQELKNTRNPLGSCGSLSPGPGLCFRSSPHHQVTKFLKSRDTELASPNPGVGVKPRCRTVIPFWTELLNVNKPKLHKGFEISPSSVTLLFSTTQPQTRYTTGLWFSPSW